MFSVQICTLNYFSAHPAHFQNQKVSQTCRPEKRMAMLSLVKLDLFGAVRVDLNDQIAKKAH